MAKKFEVGKSYKPYQDEYEPMTVVRRTNCTIWVKDEQSNWRMKIRKTATGNEYAVDTSVPQAWRDAFTYFA